MGNNHSGVAAALPRDILTERKWTCKEFYASSISNIFEVSTSKFSIPCHWEHQHIQVPEQIDKTT